MRATVIHGPNDIRLDTVPDPQLRTDNDAIVRVVASCICGSDLWNYRGINDVTSPQRIGHEFVGIVEQVGENVRSLKVGNFVIAPFAISDNTCPLCVRGVHTSCIHGSWWGSNDVDGHFTDAGQGEKVRVPYADGTLVALPSQPDESLIPHLLTLSDVFPTGHHAAVSAGVSAGSTVAVVGDGAVGLSAVLAAKRLGAAKVIAMSRHEARQNVARAFGADEIVAERGKEGAAVVRELTGGVGADYVLECVGTNDSMKQAFQSVVPGGTVGYVGVPHGVDLNVGAMFARNTALAGGVAPARAYIEELLPDVLSGKLTPGDVFDQTLTLDQVADGYKAMDERTAIKVLLKS